ncbi:MAG: hypothetical protein J6N15_01910 [Ruminiclostridium sp.]|nr:hypothetical protein [Ruminiclostridium sp.]
MFKDELHGAFDGISPSPELLDRVSAMMSEEASKPRPAIRMTAAKYAGIAAALVIAAGASIAALRLGGGIGTAPMNSAASDSVSGGASAKSAETANADAEEERLLIIDEKNIISDDEANGGYDAGAGGAALFAAQEESVEQIAEDDTADEEAPAAMAAVAPDMEAADAESYDDTVIENAEEGDFSLFSVGTATVEGGGNAAAGADNDAMTDGYEPVLPMEANEAEETAGAAEASAKAMTFPDEYMIFKDGSALSPVWLAEHDTAEWAAAGVTKEDISGKYELLTAVPGLAEDIQAQLTEKLDSFLKTE